MSSPSPARVTTQNLISIFRPVGATSPSGVSSGRVCVPRAIASANADSPAATMFVTSCVRSGKAFTKRPQYTHPPRLAAVDLLPASDVHEFEPLVGDCRDAVEIVRV